MGLIIENDIVEILYAFLLVFWIVYLYFVKDYGYWEQRDVCHIPAVFPFGSRPEIVLGKTYLGDTFDKIYTEYKDEPYVGFVDVARPGLMLRDPELIKLVLQNSFNHFADRCWFDVHPKYYMMHQLFNMKGREWRRTRQKLTPAYTAAKMKMMFHLVKKCSDLLRNVLEQMTDGENGVDVKDIFSRFTVDVIATCAFGVESNSLLNRESNFYQMGRKSLIRDYKSLLKIYIYSAFPVLTKFHCFDMLDSSITHFFTQVIRSTVEYREKHDINRYDFLDLLIKLRQNQSILEEGEKPLDLEDITSPEKREGLTIAEITAETFLFFTAGFESTSNTIMFCLYELACNSEIQEKLHCEVSDVLEKHQNSISYQALQDMTYMDQVINEALRRYPVFPHVFRICTENYRIPKSTVVIEKGVGIIIPLFSLHHDPKYFPEPHTFDPERFSPHNAKNRNKFVFLPFGEGPRMCIGFRFGMMKIKTALATVVADYLISLTPDTPVPLQFSVNSYTTIPSKSLMLSFTKRQTKMKD